MTQVEREPGEDETEAYVRGLLAERYGWTPRKIPKAATPTPDFEALADGGRVFVVEVKHFEPHGDPSHSTDASEDELMTGCLRDDNGPARVGKAIHKAAKQLQRYDCPKVLVMVNNDWSGLDVSDLHEAYAGYVSYVSEDGRRSFDLSSARIALGRIRDAKLVVDLFVWIDRCDGDAVILLPANAMGRQLRDDWFHSVTKVVRSSRDGRVRMTTAK